jgi:preprotein translocase subunit SecB
VREENSELEHLVNLRQYVLFHDDDYFVVGFDFELIQRPINSDVKIVTINATFSGRFDLTAKASEEYIRAFANLEARLIFFPYVRHFVSDLTYRMSIDPIVLPMTSELETQNPA